jgi:hypothetical protein
MLALVAFGYLTAFAQAELLNSCEHASDEPTSGSRSQVARPDRPYARIPKTWLPPVALIGLAEVEPEVSVQLLVDRYWLPAKWIVELHQYEAAIGFQP